MAVDATGLYPLFCCDDWSGLEGDLHRIERDLVSLTIVTDPLGDHDTRTLGRVFDLVRPFKDHYIADLSVPLKAFVSKSHRQNARRALRKVQVEICETPWQHLDAWLDLYATLVERHGVTGLRAFSRRSFERQLRTPGMVMFRARVDDRTVGLDLWYVDGDVAQGHLAAFSPEGYRTSASYATKWCLLNHFVDKVRWVNLGGLAGSPGKGAAGLAHFKRGWTNVTRPTYLCGRIFDAAAYDALTRMHPATDYFPAYRAGEV